MRNYYAEYIELEEYLAKCKREDTLAKLKEVEKDRYKIFRKLEIAEQKRLYAQEYRARKRNNKKNLQQ